MILIGCSSTPPGTDKLKDLVNNPAEKLGKDVVVVGLADTKTPLASFKMFRLFDDGNSMWIRYPEGVEEPPQGINVRVFGKLQQETFNVIGKVYFIDATKIAME